MLFKVAKSFASAPKEIAFTTFRLSNIFTAPLAKFSALEILYTVGNSITRSAPPQIAIYAFAHLFTMEVSPLCVKFPDMTATQYSAPVISFVACKW